jgi:hypothetical protein
MANTKISGLTAGAPALSTDLLPIDRSGTNYSLMVLNLGTTILNGAYTPTGTFANMALVGTPTATTQSPFNNSTDIATTAYVDQQEYSGGTTQWAEDFISAGNVTVGAANTAFQADHAWFASAISAGTTQTVAGGTGTFQNPGQVTMTTTATATQGVALFTTSGGVASLGLLGGNANWQVDMWFTSPTVITNVAFRAGMCSAGQQATDPPSNGIWVEYDTVNANSTQHLTLRTQAASTSNYVSTAATVAAGLLYHVRLFSTAATTIYCQTGTANTTLNTAVSSATDVPTSTALLPFFQVIPRTAAANAFYVDRWSIIAASGRI